MSNIGGPLEKDSSPSGKTFDWAPLAWFAALTLVCYGVVLWRLGEQWLTNDDMSHGIFVPFLAGYIVWQKWPELTAAPTRPSLWGLLYMIVGALMLCIGPPSLPTFTFITRLAFFSSLFGLILLLKGWPTIRILRYPFVIALFMIPLPGFLYERITLPLQFVASFLAEQSLDLLGYSVLREGNVLRLPHQTLEVAEACSGLRSLLSLSFLGQAYIYLFDRKVWMRFAIAAAIIPIAVIANTGRIVFTAIMSNIDKVWASGIYHESAGWVVFVIAFVALLFTHRVINSVYDLLSAPQRKLSHV